MFINGLILLLSSIFNHYCNDMDDVQEGCRECDIKTGTSGKIVSDLGPQRWLDWILDLGEGSIRP